MPGRASSERSQGRQPVARDRCAQVLRTIVHSFDSAGRDRDAAVFIGGGGYGTLIVRGLALNDNSIILAGALPAAVMALVIHGGLEMLDRVLLPQGLRQSMNRD